MGNMELIDPNLVGMGALFVPIVTDLGTKLGVASKTKQWVATVVTLIVIGVSLLIHVAAGNIAISTTGDAYELAVFLVAQFSLVRAAVEGGHRGQDLVEQLTGKKVARLTPPDFGIGRPVLP